MELNFIIPKETPMQKAERILLMCLHECPLWKGNEPEYIEWINKQRTEIKICFDDTSKDELSQFYIDKIYLVKSAFNYGLFNYDLIPNIELGNKDGTHKLPQFGFIKIKG